MEHENKKYHIRNFVTELFINLKICNSINVSSFSIHFNQKLYNWFHKNFKYLSPEQLTDFYYIDNNILYRFENYEYIKIYSYKTRPIYVNPRLSSYRYLIGTKSFTYNYNKQIIHNRVYDI